MAQHTVVIYRDMGSHTSQTQGEQSIHRSELIQFEYPQRVIAALVQQSTE